MTTNAGGKGRKREGPGIITLLSSVFSTGAGTAFRLSDTFTDFGMQVIFSGTTGDSAKVVLQAANTTEAFFTLPNSTWNSTGGDASGDMVFVFNKPVQYVRANVLEASSSETISAYLSVR